MQNRPMKMILTGLSLLLMASAAQARINVSNLGPPPPAQTPITGSWYQHCTKGNFIGEAWGTYSVLGHRWTANTTAYKITKLNDQKGGNKANLNLGISEAGSGLDSSMTKSADNLIQGYHSPLIVNLERTREITRYSNRPNPDIKIEFVFDKKGNDPKCTSTYKMRT